MDGKKIMYSPFEKQVFKEVFAKFSAALNNDTIRGNRPDARQERTNIWEKITSEFNSVEGVNKRTMQQCKKLLQNMKTERKEVKKVIRKNYFDTGNKQPIPLPHPETDVLDNSNFLVMPIEGTLDSDMMGDLHLSNVELCESPTSKPTNSASNMYSIGCESEDSGDVDTPASISDNSLNEKIGGHFISTAIEKADDSPCPAVSTLLTKACTRKRARKQELIVDEFDARCKRVQQQSMHDTEAHKYLIKKLENEANLAQQMCEKAEIEQEMLKEQREHQKKKQEIEMQLAENHKNFERKKQEMEIEFLKTKHCLELEKLKN
ncbi:hypothetical protein M8J75_016488 [Diaphorina citri]|nr:hypothetical protein M8J75_003681 [Diaphorina citri]KAI5698858.1 hypothetical protein M8J75_012806 [Diaphorina citri]KAI5705565.1 hypothetical protein M8J75_016488 [Diaphorina citri]